MVKTIIDLVQHDINEIKTKKAKNSISSLSSGEQEAIKHLAKRRHIIIMTAKKGDAVVNMNTENYIKEANCSIKTITKYFKKTYFTTQ